MYSQDVYDEGAYAWLSGVLLEENPYITGTESQYLNWEEGWLDARWEDELNG